MSEERDRPAVYVIPPNYKSNGTFFGGTLKIRNAVEAASIAFVLLNFIFRTSFSLYVKVVICILTVLPIAILFLVGIDGESLTSFVFNVVKFLINRKVVGKSESSKPKQSNKIRQLIKKHAIAENDTIIVKKGERIIDNTYVKTVNQAAAYLPVKEIKNGIIYTKDNRYVKFLEIEPINFMLRSTREQRSIINSFISFLKISPVKMQFKTITKKADINNHLDTVREHMKQETNANCKELQNNYVNLVQEVGTRVAISRRFLLIFEYERGYGTHPKDSEAEAVAQLRSVAQTISSYLRQCGNEVITSKNEDEFMTETLYSMLNRDQNDAISFKDHITDVIKRYVAEHGEVEQIMDIPVAEFFAPKSIDYTNGSYVKIDGMYYSYLLIPSDGYKPYVVAGWTGLLVNAGEGIDVDLFIRREAKDVLHQKLGREIRLNRSRIKDTSDTNTDFDDLGGAIASGYFLKQGLSNNEDFYYMNILITITAYSEKELEWRVNEMKKLLISQDIEIYKCNFRQEQAFLSSLPLLYMNKYLYERSKRNLLTQGVASCYPFTSFEMCDDNGVLLGVNKHNHSLVVIDIFNSKVYKNANMVLLGTSGSGKTFTLQLLALRMRMKGIHIFIICPLKGHEFYRACKSIGGEFVQISPASPNCINIMEIRKTDTIAHDLIDECNIEKSKLAAKIQTLHIFFSLRIPDMTHEERQLLDDALIKTYEAKGITHDNDSLFMTGGKAYKQMPVLGDLYDILAQKEETKRLANFLHMFVHGSAKSFNQQTNVNLNNLYSVLDISELKGDLLTLGMFISLDYVYDIVKEDRTKEKVMIMDELWSLIGASSNRLAAEYVLEIFKIIRGYGGSAIGSSQDINDFFALEDGKYGKGILNSSKTKIMLNLEDDEVERVRGILKLSDMETDAILKFNRGEALLSTNSNKVTVNIKASPLELELITTDREELKEIAKKKQAEKAML